MFQRPINQLRATLKREDIRFPLQTVVAVLLACAAMRLFQLPDISWGAFSALFVLQASVGGTVSTAGSRILGALVGMVLGVSAVMLAHAMEGPGWSAILAGVAVMSYLSVRWPSLSYGLVTVAVITVAPDWQLVEGALVKAVSIIVGSLSGVLAGLVIMPVFAHRRAPAKLASSIRDLSDVLCACAHAQLNSTPDADRSALQQRIAVSLAQAREMATASKMERQARRRSVRKTTAGLGYVERIWHTSTLLERLSDVPLPDAYSRDLRKPLLSLTSTLHERLQHTADVIEKDADHSPCVDFEPYIVALSNFVREAEERGDIEKSEDREQCWAFVWAWRTVSIHAQRLCQFAESTDDDAQSNETTRDIKP